MRASWLPMDNPPSPGREYCQFKKRAAADIIRNSPVIYRSAFS